MFLHQSTLDLLNSKGNSQSIWFINYSALEKMDSLEAMEGEHTHIQEHTLAYTYVINAHFTYLLFCALAGDVELEWEETTM